MQPTRRQLLPLAALGALAPGRLLAAPRGSERRFLFVHAVGGWDPCCVFAPMFDAPLVDDDDQSEPTTIGGMRLVDSPDRPAVRSFFERHGAATCVVNGVEVRSVAHTVCERLVLTGTSLPAGDDWAARLGAASTTDALMPALTLSGRSYTYALGGEVVRVGPSGQLPALLDGVLLAETNPRLAPPPGRIRELEARWLRDRAAAHAAAARPGRARELASGHLEARTRLDALEVEARALQLDPGEDLGDQLDTALAVLSAGLSRCVTVAHRGFRGLSWDTHAANHNVQSDNYDELFGALDRALLDAATLPAAGGGTLADELVVVVLSEMGRHPRINGRGGKEHWTWTSAMLAGAGVAGGQVLGGFEDTLAGSRVDLGSGLPHASGVGLLPGHLGATLLALGDVDPGESLADTPPIAAVLA
jgi:hypothetical protein